MRKIKICNENQTSMVGDNIFCNDCGYKKITMKGKCFFCDDENRKEDYPRDEYKRPYGFCPECGQPVVVEEECGICPMDGITGKRPKGKYYKIYGDNGLYKDSVDKRYSVEFPNYGSDYNRDERKPKAK